MLNNCDNQKLKFLKKRDKISFAFLKSFLIFGDAEQHNNNDAQKRFIGIKG